MSIPTSVVSVSVDGEFSGPWIAYSGELRFSRAGLWCDGHAVANLTQGCNDLKKLSTETIQCIELGKTSGQIN
jgi:hypothetical protein